MRHVLLAFHGDDSSINFGCEVAFFIRPDVTDVQSGCCNVPRSTPPVPSTRPFHNALQWRTKSSAAGRRSNEDEGCIAKVDEITFLLKGTPSSFGGIFQRGDDEPVVRVQGEGEGEVNVHLNFLAWNSIEENFKELVSRLDAI